MTGSKSHITRILDVSGGHDKKLGEWKTHSGESIYRGVYAESRAEHWAGVLVILGTGVDQSTSFTSENWSSL
jgi:hypothetical protein